MSETVRKELVTKYNNLLKHEGNLKSTHHRLRGRSYYWHPLINGFTHEMGIGDLAIAIRNVRKSIKDLEEEIELLTRLNDAKSEEEIRVLLHGYGIHHPPRKLASDSLGISVT